MTRLLEEPVAPIINPSRTISSSPVVPSKGSSLAPNSGRATPQGIKEFLIPASSRPMASSMGSCAARRQRTDLDERAVPADRPALRHDSAGRDFSAVSRPNAPPTCTSARRGSVWPAIGGGAHPGRHGQRQRKKRNASSTRLLEHAYGRAGRRARHQGAGHLPMNALARTRPSAWPGLSLHDGLPKGCALGCFVGGNAGSLGRAAEDPTALSPTARPCAGIRPISC